MTQDVLLVGASGLAREVLAAGIAGVVGILDDAGPLQGRTVGGVQVVGDIAQAAERDEQLLICIGPSAGRRSVIGRLEALGVTADRYTTFIAGSARVGTTSTVAEGSILLDGVVVTADAAVGRHVVVMPTSTITHDCVIADYATLAAGVTLGGSVRVGTGAYLGMNSSIRQGLVIGASATVGMGAVVLSDVPPAQTWAGVPARALEVHA